MIDIVYDTSYITGQIKVQISMKFAAASARSYSGQSVGANLIKNT